MSVKLCESAESVCNHGQPQAYFSCEVHGTGTIMNNTFYVAFYVTNDTGTRMNNNEPLSFFESDLENVSGSACHKNGSAAGYHLAASARQESNTTHYTVNLNLTISPLFSNSEKILSPIVSCQTDSKVINKPIKAELDLGG